MSHENKPLWIWLTITVATLALVFSVGLTGEEPVAATSPVAEPAPPGSDEVAATLEKLRYTWMPSERQVVLDAAHNSIVHLDGALLWWLDGPSDRLLEAALYLTGELRVHAALERVRYLARWGPRRYRAQAIAAAELLAPWQLDDLAALLRRQDPAVQLAVLELLESRDERPAAEILRLLRSASRPVRESALRLVPRQLSSESLARLQEWCRYPHGEDGAYALRALGRTRLDRASSELLYGALEHLDPAIRRAALGGLAASGARLAQPMRVWQMVVDSTEAVELRAAALICLERTVSYDADLLAGEVYGLDPVLRYFAARCLVRSGVALGIEILLELVELADDQLATIPRLPARTVRFAAMKLLATMSASTPRAGCERWREWFRELRAGSDWRRQLPELLSPELLGAD